MLLARLALLGAFLCRSTMLFVLEALVEVAVEAAVELLEETIAYDEGTAIGDTASQTLNRIVGTALSEAQIESLIIDKGFSDCVTYMADDTVSVAVSAPADGLSQADVALISDVVTSQTDYDLSQVRVIEVKAP